MKAISVRQPWAYLVASGVKDIENRTWKLPEAYKGETILIHTGAETDKEPYMIFNDEQIEKIESVIMDVCSSYGMTSAIIGSVRFTDCFLNHSSVWAERTPGYSSCLNATLFKRKEGIKPIYNWVCSDAVLFDKPILHVKGKLSFWDYEISAGDFFNRMKGVAAYRRIFCDKLYHGSPTLINDDAMASETYFTDDIKVARSYGRYIYEIEVDSSCDQAFVLDSLEEHFISTCLLPMGLFRILDSELTNKIEITWKH